MWRDSAAPSAPYPMDSSSAVPTADRPGGPFLRPSSWREWQHALRTKSRRAIQNHVIERLERSQIPPALKDRFHLDDPYILARDAPAP
jgi:hypothetical protein